MNDIYPVGGVSPYESYYKCHLPTMNELIAMQSSELARLSAKLSHAYKVVLTNCDISLVREFVSTPREFGVELKRNHNSTIKSLTARLKDRKWWGAKVTRLADEMREHQAQISGMLGGKHSTMKCCSNATVEIFRERKLRSDRSLKSKFKAKTDISGNVMVFSLYDISELSKKSRLNEMFMNIKAMEAIAENKSFGCAFITLTAAPEFHSNPKHGKNTYNGSTARMANMSIQKDWRSILDGFDNIGIKRKGGSYFGFRVAELHEDGCPHWHILMFFDKGLGILESAIKSIKRLYMNRGLYFDTHKDDIVRIIEKTSEESARPSSYIFKYIAYALGEGEGIDDGLAYRYKCGIRSMGARQFDFFGLKCSMGKQRALKSIARTDSAPEHIHKMAQELHLPKDAINRYERQLQARIEFLEGCSDDLEVGQDTEPPRVSRRLHLLRNWSHYAKST